MLHYIHLITYEESNSLNFWKKQIKLKRNLPAQS